MKSKLSVLTVLLTLSFFIAASVAEAQNRHSSTELGIILGEPTGLSLKLWQSNNTAFDAGFAWSFGGNGALHIHADYLRHSWLDINNGDLALYYGLGGRLLLRDDPRVGARIPVGMQYIIPDTRLSVFFEVAPLLDLVPATSFEVNGGLGIRLFI